MIDPINLTDFNRTKEQLEEMLIFSILVAGKNALTTAKSTEIFLKLSYELSVINSPFDSLKSFSKEEIQDLLYISNIGCSSIKAKSLYQLVNKDLNLKTCNCEELEKIFGIGPKTARMFLLHSRKNMKLAVLDTHILKYLKDQGIEVPKSTPTGKKYLELEKIFIDLAKGKNLAEWDLFLWKKYSKH